MVCKHEEEVAGFKKALGSEVATLRSKQKSMFTMVENELMKRCFSFNLHLSCGELWTSPPFLTHRGGYQLQMAAETDPPTPSSLDMARKRSLFFQREDRFPVVLCLHVLPRSNDAETLDWPVYVTADVLVLTNSDASAHGKLHTLIEYKELVDDAAPTLFGHNRSVIGHAESTFNCRIVVIKLEHSPEPPVCLPQ